MNLNNKITNFEREIVNSQSKNLINDKNEIIDFQKKYLYEMKDLQKNFEEFKIKTYHQVILFCLYQLKTLKMEKEDALNNMNYYKESHDKILAEFEQNETKNKELIKKLKKKYEEAKLTIKNNEFLKSKVDETKNEVSYLKLQVNKLENSERKLHNLLMEKEKINSEDKGNYIENLNKNLGIDNDNNMDFKLSSSKYYS